MNQFIALARDAGMSMVKFGRLSVLYIAFTALSWSVGCWRDCKQHGQGLAKDWLLHGGYTGTARGLLTVNLVKLYVFICWLSMALTNIKGRDKLSIKNSLMKSHAALGSLDVLIFCWEAPFLEVHLYCLCSFFFFPTDFDVSRTWNGESKHVLWNLQKACLSSLQTGWRSCKP